MIVAPDVLMSTLESATNLPSFAHDAAFVSVKFADGVQSAQRASMWAEPTSIHLGTWAGELKPQYERLYSNAAVIDALVALGDEGWILRPNFHLAFHNSHWKQRWYPSNSLLSAEAYLRQWMTDLPNAGRLPRADVEAPSYSRWLLDRAYITEREADSLAEWLGGMRRQKIDVRPSVALERVWHEMPSATDVRSAIDEVLTALDEPRLGQGRQTSSKGRSAAVPKTRTPEERRTQPCPHCFVALPATGECDCR